MEEVVLPVYNPMDKDYRENPFPYYHQLRKRDPIHYSSQFKAWIISRYEDAITILQSDAFGVQTHQDAGDSPMAKVMQQWFTSKNAPEHTKLRHVMHAKFSPKSLKNVRQFADDYANQLLIPLKTSDTFDIVREFAYPLPIAVMCHLVGIPMEDCEQIRQLTVPLFSLMESVFRKNPLPDEFMVLEKMQKYLENLIDKQRQSEQDTIIHYLLKQEDVLFSKNELIANVLTLILGGFETTALSIANAIYALLQHQDQCKQLLNDQDLLESSIEETLRYYPAVQRISRVALKDYYLSNHLINQGQSVLILVGAVNRDPDKFEQPDQFNIHRYKNKHLTFGIGRHFCLGASLSRLEIKVAIQTFFKHFPRAALASNKINYRHSVSFRAMESLIVKNGLSEDGNF